MSDELIEWLDRQNISIETAETFGITQTSKGGAPCATYPTEVGFQRIAYFSGPIRHDWKNKREVSAHWYGISQARDLLEDGDPLYLVATELEVWRLYDLGIPAVTTCMTGEAWPVGNSPVADYRVRVFYPATMKEDAEAVALRLDRDDIDAEIRSIDEEMSAQLEMKSDEQIDIERMDAVELANIVGENISEYLWGMKAYRPQESETASVYLDGPGELDMGEWLFDELKKESEGVEPVYCDGEIWQCHGDKRAWRKMEANVLENRVASLKGRAWYEYETKEGLQTKPVQLRKVSTVKNAVERTRMLGHHAEFFEDAPKTLGFQNGTLLVSGRDLMFTSGHFAENRIKDTQLYDFDYRPGHTSTFLEEYFDVVFENCDDRAERIEFLARWLGIAILGMSTRYMRALCLKGPPGCGKSTLIDIMRSLFPDNACCEIPLQEFGDDTKMQGIQGAKLNYVYEGPRQRIKSAERLKSIIEGSPLMLNIKYMREPLRFSPIAAHVIAFNRLPSITGSAQDVYDRLSVITMERRIRGTELEDRDFADKVITEREGVVGWALEGAQRALDEDNLALPPSCWSALSDWASTADSVAIWFAQCVDTSAEPPKYLKQYPTKHQTYEHYQRWCSDHGHHPVNSTEFKARLESRGYPVKTSGYDVFPFKVIDLEYGPAFH